MNLTGKMFYNPSIYEINIRVFLKRFDRPNYKARLSDVPNDYWSSLVSLGFDYIWLMGIWNTNETTINKYCFEEGLVKSYSKALKDWKPEDVIGSPYSIDSYELNPNICTVDELLKFKKYLNSLGMKLLLDFIPNHLSSESHLIYEQPEIFLQVEEKNYLNDPYTYFQPNIIEKKFFAHGRDPFFPAWQDTAQVNICSRTARNYFIEVLSGLTALCDGVRCDMAMLALSNVFKNTWAGALNPKCWQDTPTEFWHELITNTRNKRSDFVFIAEAYWDLEWQLQQLGFDYTYDKRLTDRLKHAHPYEIIDHLKADVKYQQKSMRFIENHDEDRAVTDFGKEKSKAAAIIISTIIGARLFNEGQFEGRKIKLPVQLGREPEEKINDEVKQFYLNLLNITSHNVFKFGEWKLITLLPSWIDNNFYRNMMAWEWKLKEERRVVIINYSPSISACRMKLDISGYQEELVLTDLLNSESYTRSAEEIYHTGLYVELKPYHAHIFSF